ncbi:MAG TPA: SCO family protein [Solirubrobacteraceae bacterium]|nr:SCO family protein [Solirubrobacteraceae bacterium]
MTYRTRIALLAAVTALVATLVIVAVVAGPSGTGSGSGSPKGTSEAGFDGAALPPGVRAKPFTLTALASPPGEASIGGGGGLAGGPAGGSHGGTVSLAQFAGKVVVMAFLYPGCGHTCTLIADQIRGALDELGREPAVVIVDASQTDGTHARARGRVHRIFEETGLAGRAYYLTGSQRQLKVVWRAYGVVPASAGKAKFDEYAQVLLIDGKGNERVLFGAEDLTAEGLAHDVGRLQTGA